MRLHGNARTCLHSRLLIVRRVLDQGWTVAAAAEAAGVSERTAAKWLARYRSEGRDGLGDRSSAPHRIPCRTPAERVRVIELLRRLRMTAAEIAEVLRMPLSTVSLVLKRIGLGKRSRLEPFEPANRYECARAGELVHVDVKKLGRIDRPGHRVTGDRSDRRNQGKKGWEYVHIAVDDYSRLAYAEVLGDEKAKTAVGFLRRAVRFYRRYGIRVEAVISDNGSAYVSIAHAVACRRLKIRHLRTRPYRPQTNGKAERFIRTMLTGWAYGPIYGSSRERTTALDGWLWHYNHQRRHSALGHQPPISRTNLLGSYS
jgi:transposase InsO family protein